MSEKQRATPYRLEHWMKHTDFETRVEYWMKHSGYESLAGEPSEMTHEVIRRLLARNKAVEDDDDDG